MERGEMMLCPKCHAMTRTKRIRIDLRGYAFRRRKCKQGHWFDTKEWGFGERLVGDVIDLRELVRKYAQVTAASPLGQSREKASPHSSPILTSVLAQERVK